MQTLWLKKLTDPLLENVAFLQGQAICLRDDRDDVDDFAELLHHDDVNGPERVTGWVDEVQAAVDTRIQDVAVTNSSQLLTKVRAVLVLDIFNNRIPAR